MDDNFYVPKVYKDNEDKVKDLFRKQFWTRQSWQRSLLIKHRTGMDRIAEVVLLFLKWHLWVFEIPIIPVKVTH
jgi:capsule polysaccharide modification protein KpsS